MKKIIGIGNALVDVLARLDDDNLLESAGLPKGGMQLIDEQKQTELRGLMQGLSPQQATGGSAGNAMLALANLEAHPGFVGKVGNDEMGQFFVQNCHQTGIEARLVQCDRHTGVANTFISPNGERTFGTCLGAAALLTADEVSEDMFCGYDILHIEGYLVQNHELIEKVCRIAKSLGMKLSIDLASYNVVAADLAFFRHLVEDYIDIVFANEEESAAFTEGQEPDDALQSIAKMCEIAVVKLGSKGAMAMCGEEKAQVPAHKVQVVDTTAAGDFFAGGFLYAYARDAKLEDCLRCGALLSGHVIQVVGTRLPDQEWNEIRKLLNYI